MPHPIAALSAPFVESLMGGEAVGVFRRQSLPGGVDLMVWTTPKFKTLMLRVSLLENLDGHAGQRALLSALLKRGCRSHPDMMSLSRYLEQLYGASLSFDVGRFGERQNTNLHFRVVNDRFVGGQAHALQQGLDLLQEVLTEPITEAGGFPVAEFEQERNNLIHAIRGLLDDKIAYAHQRLLEEMFRGEPYALLEWGDEASVAGLDRTCVLEEHLLRMRRAPIEVYAVGDFQDREIDMIRDAMLALTPRDELLPVVPETIGHRGERRTVIDEYPVSQSKLLIGYRLDSRGLDDRDHFALGLYNVLLGGGSNASKLFKQVREERGLAYYAHSSLDRLKGFLALSAGVAARHWEEAADVMREQVVAMSRGAFDEEELRVAKSVILNSLESLNDSAGQAAGFVAAARVAGRPADVEVVARIVRDLTRDDVIRVASLPVEETSYLLKGTLDDGTAPD